MAWRAAVLVPRGLTRRFFWFLAETGFSRPCCVELQHFDFDIFPSFHQRASSRPRLAVVQTGRTKFSPEPSSPCGIFVESLFRCAVSFEMIVCYWNGSVVARPSATSSSKPQKWRCKTQSRCFPDHQIQGRAAIMS